MATALIGASILCYGIWVVRKKWKDFREGRDCCRECCGGCCCERREQ